MISWQAVTELSAEAVRVELASHEPITVRVHGHSMRPLLRHGDLVRLRRARDQEPHIGDIIATECDGSLLLHRVTHVNHDTVQTHGDASAAPDQPVPKTKVLGVANSVETRAGVWVPLFAGRALGATLRGLRRLRGQLR